MGMIKPIAKVTAQLGVQQMEGLTLFMDDYEQHAGETVLEKSARVGNAMQTKVLMSAGAEVGPRRRTRLVDGIKQTHGDTALPELVQKALKKSTSASK